MHGYGQGTFEIVPNLGAETTIEDSGVDAEFLIRLRNGLPGDAVIIEISLGGTANQATDYATVNTTITTTLNGVGNRNVFIDITPISDDIQEADETVVVSFTSVTGLFTTFIASGPTAAEVEITNDDFAGVEVDKTAGTTTEDLDTDSFRFTLTSEPTAPVTININGYEPDETTGPTSIEIQPSQWDTGVLLTIQGLDDNIVDGDFVDIINTGNVSSADPNYSVFTGPDIPQLTVTNLENDVGVISFDFTANPGGGAVGFVDEAIEGGTQGNFRIQIDKPKGEGVPLNVDFTLTGTATSSGANDDYDLLGEAVNAAQNLVVYQNELIQFREIPVEAFSDALNETDETVIMTLTGVDNPLFSIDPANNQAIVTIKNTVPPGFNVSAISNDTSEDETTATFDVVLTAQPLTDVVFDLVSEDPSEGTLTPATLTFTNANWDERQTVTVTGVDDLVVDGSQTYDVTVSVNAGSSDAAFATLPDELVSITNLDNDEFEVSITAANAIATENPTANGTFSVSLNQVNATGSALVVSFQLSGSAILNADYDLTPVSAENLSTGTVSIPNGSSEAIITLIPANDTEVEPDENVIITLSAGVGYEINPAAEDATVTIESDDVSTISIDDVTLVEGNTGTTDFIFTVSIDGGGAALEEIEFDYSTANGIATVGDNDYERIVSEGGEIEIGETSATITVEVNADTKLEGNETFFVNIGNPINAAISDGQGQGVITNDDSATVSISNVSGAEDSDPMTFSAVLDNAVQGGFSVNYTLTGGTATAGVDFDASPGTLNFDGNQGEVQPIDIPIVDDDIVENGETFIVQLGIPTNSVVLSGDGSASGTILDDDNCLPSPVLDTSQPTNFCDILEADLDDYIIGDPPAGSQLIWSTSPNQLQESAYRPSEVTSPGTYFGFYLDEDNDCFSPAIEVTLGINITPEVLGFTESERCGDGSVTLSATGTVGATLNWYATASSTTILGAGPSFTTPSIEETTSFFVEATANGCPSERVEVVAIVNFEPSPGIPNDTIGCAEAGPDDTTILDLNTALTGADPGIWSIVTDPSNGGVVIDANGNVDFEGLPFGDYVFLYTTINAEAPCTNQSVEVTITVVDCLLDADFDGLNDSEEELIGTDPNNPDTDGDGIEDGQEVNVDDTDPLDDCDSVGGTPLPDNDCDNDGLTNEEEADLGTDPFDADSDDDGLTDGEEVLAEDDPSTDSVPEGPSDPLDPCDPFLTDDCNAEPIDILVEKVVDVSAPLINDIINFTITAINQSMERGVNIVVSDLIDDTSGFEFLSSSVDSGSYDETTGLWTIPELLGEASTNLFISVRVTQLGSLQNTANLISSVPEDGDASNNSATVDITVSQSECVDVGTLCNLFSPNGDGVNDTLVLVGHQNYPSSKLEVFDRYGNLVFEADGYSSNWDGTGENGNLPRGTYFYLLNLGDGSDVVKGWIQIIR